MSGFLDTNVVVRYLIRDDPLLTERAERIIDGESELYVTGVVLHEVAHVLRSVYSLPRAVIVDRLVDLLQKRNILMPDLNKDQAKLGLLLCRPSGRVSFGDALIWAAVQSSSVRVVYSFDQRFPADGMEVRQDLP